MNAGERVTCSCGTTVVGAKSLVTAARPRADLSTGAVLPVATQPDPEKGNVLLQQIDGELRAIVLGDEPLLQYLRDHGVQLRPLHFACGRELPTRPEGTA